MSPHPVEVAWFGALCDDDYEYLGVPETHLASSWTHCSDIVRAADRNGFDSVLLPSGYDLGIDSTAFAAAIATHTDNIHLLLAVRIGEMWLPQLARQLASIDQFANGRLTINVISSDMPGETLASGPRYQRTREWMRGLRSLLSGEVLEMQGDFVELSVAPPRATTLNGQCPPLYFGGFSEDAKDVAASEADVFLTWPDTVASVSSTVEEMQNRARSAGKNGRKRMHREENKHLRHDHYSLKFQSGKFQAILYVYVMKKGTLGSITKISRAKALKLLQNNL